MKAKRRWTDSKQGKMSILSRKNEVSRIHGLQRTSCIPQKSTSYIQLSAPKNVTEIRRVLRTFSWYCRFIPDFSENISPMTALLKKTNRFVWNDECERLFVAIKKQLLFCDALIIVFHFKYKHMHGVMV